MEEWKSSSPTTLFSSINKANVFALFDEREKKELVGWAAGPPSLKKFHQSTNNQFHWIVEVDLISFLQITGSLSFALLISRNQTRKGAAKLFNSLLFFELPIRKSNSLRKEGIDWAAAAVSIAIPFIIPFKNSKFFHSMNMQQLYWRQITVIISFLIHQSISWMKSIAERKKKS